MQNATIKFDLIKLDGNKFIVDPTSIFIKGRFNWNLLHSFLFEGTYSCLPEIGEGMTEGQCKEIFLEIWEENGDDGSWIEYKVLDIAIEK